MPLTSKGQEIMANMKKEYGEKKGEEVFYASKNSGKISGVDADGMEEEGVGAESWVHGKKNSSGYRIDRLPTADQFRKRFRDGVRAGMPIEKILALGTVWNGVNSKGKEWQADKAAYGRLVRDAMSKGLTADKALAFANDQMDLPDESFDAMSPQYIAISKPKPIVDQRLHFRGAMKDALKSGKGFGAAIRHATDQCSCGK